MRRLPIITALAMLATLAACGKPADTITEIETGVNGVKVETADGREHYLRPGIDRQCDTGDRLWHCATRRDLLVPQR